MRGVRRDKTKVRTGARQQLNASHKIIGQLVEPARVKRGNGLIDVEAVDNQMRIPSVGLAGAKPRDDRAVIVDSGFWSKSADHPTRSHTGGDKMHAAP